MCQPTNFSIRYQINPWMKVDSIDSQKAQSQWENLIKTYKKANINVIKIQQNQDFPDMVFTTDSFIIKGNTALLANFFHPQRQAEPEIFEPLLSSLNFKIKKIPDQYKFEGGDFRFYHNKLFLGYGFRTQKDSISQLKRILKTRIIPIQLINPKYYHLDTCFFILNENHAFYIKDAISSHSLHDLKMHFTNLHQIQKSDQQNFAANSVVYGNNVIGNTHLDQFKSQIINLGYNFLEVDISEFLKSGGGIHCLSNLVN